MKAIQQIDYQGIDTLQLREFSEPGLSPISVKVQNCFVPVLPYDILIEEGKLRELRPMQLPQTISYGFAGIVTEVGTLRQKSLIGQKVIGMDPTGSAKEVVVSNIPPALIKVPPEVSLAEAATVIGGGDAAWMALKKLRVSGEDTVLVTGASGGVGSYLVQFLHLLGAEVIVLASGQNLGFVRELGADHVIDYRCDQVVEEMRRGPQPNKIIDTVGHPSLLMKISDAYEAFELLTLSTKEFPVGHEGQRFFFANGGILPKDYQRILAMLAEGKVKAQIQSIYDFKEVRQAQHESKESHSHGRILLRFAEE